ncbi:MAG: efflux RND transporter permease subunit [Waddliaceae bacterium]
MNEKGGPIAWMAKHHVAANLLLVIFILGGFLVTLQIKQEVFPEYELPIIQVVVPYPGASPDEVEEGIILSIEDEVRGIDGVKKVTSTAYENQGVVTIELLRDADGGKALQDVKNEVDQIQSLPEEAERPIINLLEPKRQVISLILYGESDRLALFNLAESIREEVIQIDGITLVELHGVPNVEISIEIPQDTLRAYGLTLEEVANLVRNTALDLPAGGIRTPSGEVLIRTQERRNLAKEFEDIPVISTREGAGIRLDEIANIKEQFEETDQEAYFNGHPAIRIDVFRVGDQTPIEISNKIHAYTKDLQKYLPENIYVTTWNDSAEVFRDRISLLIRNAALGLVLVLILLGLFLEPRLAFWVTLGIPASILGSFLLIPFTGASINMIALFAFIVTLGIVVDDAVVVGENIYYKREKGMPFLQASIEGAKEISGPVIFAVLTNIVAFIPLLYVPGTMGKLFLQIPSITISIFLISLIESLFVLPAHLSREHKKSRFFDTLAIPSKTFEKYLKKFIENIYVPQLKFAIHFRYITVSCGIALLILTAGGYFGGYITFSFLPRVDSDIVSAQATLPYGSPKSASYHVQGQMIQNARNVINDNGGEKISRGIYSQIGTTLPGRGPANSTAFATGSHLVGVQVFLVPSDQREISGVEFAKQWRNKVGSALAVDTLEFVGHVTTVEGKPIEFDLSHPDTSTLETAATELASILQNYSGVKDISDGVAEGKPQLSFKLTPEARSLGITAGELARQVRHSFYGAEALRQQRGRNEMKIMVRLPQQERERIQTIEDLVIRTPEGGEITLSEAAKVEQDRAYTEIRRSDGRRINPVSADVEEEVANANLIVEDLIQNVMPRLMEKYPGLTYRLAGEQQEQQEAISALGNGFIFALIGIYTLLAIPFRSYIQPLIVMLSIPFGIIGAVLGHLLLGYELSIVSMFGMIALSGVVVNDSLVLIVTANELYRKENLPLFKATIEASKRRFRPILLTSLTTFFGLCPMIFETSMQARFLIPMAISLGFGILFATFIILLLTPCFYLIIEDLKGTKE